MKIQFKYYFLFCVLIFTTISHVAAQTQEKDVDSLLDDATNSAYKNPDKAISTSLSIFNNTSYSIKTRTRALLTLSLGYNSKRDYKKALDYIIKANEFSNRIDDKNLKIQILFMTGVQYQQLKIYDKAIEYMEEVEIKALNYPVRDSVSSTLASSYLVKGFVYKNNLNCNIALEFFDKALKEFERVGGNYHNRSIGYYNKGNCHILLSEYTKAKASFIKSIELAKQKNANSLVSFAEKGMAEVYTLEGKYEEAIKLLVSALDKSKDVGDLVLNVEIYEGLFENNLAINNWEDFEKYHKLFLKTQLEIKASERNSVSVSLKENTKNLTAEINQVESKFKKNFKLIFLTVIIFIIIVFILEIKNKKIIKSLQKQIEITQNIKPLIKTKK